MSNESIPVPVNPARIQEFVVQAIPAGRPRSARPIDISLRRPGLGEAFLGQVSNVRVLVPPAQEPRRLSSNCDCEAPKRSNPDRRRPYLTNRSGTAVMRHVAELVRAEGATELLTSFVPGDSGPAGFYQRLGFVPTGELDDSGEVIVRLGLPSA